MLKLNIHPTWPQCPSVPLSALSVSYSQLLFVKVILLFTEEYDCIKRGYCNYNVIHRLFMFD